MLPIRNRAVIQRTKMRRANPEFCTILHQDELSGVDAAHLEQLRDLLARIAPQSDEGRLVEHFISLIIGRQPYCNQPETGQK